jgi:hypothetical protein
MPVTGEQRRSALLQMKLGALAKQHWASGGTPGAFPNGATLLDAGAKTAWVLAETPDYRVLGQALAWTLRHGATELHLLVGGVEGDGDAGGLLARRAQAFKTPVRVWSVDGREIEMVEPAPFSPPPPLPHDAAIFADVLRSYGADPVVEWGVLTGEVLGLEVARVITDDGPARLEVGVGRHDRVAQRLLFPDRPVEIALEAAIATVRRLRTDRAQPHLANTLATERWLRAVVVAHPELVGAALLAPAPPLVRRGDLRQPVPAPAAGVDREERPLVVVCSTGIDLDAVPAAADARLADGRPGCRVVVAVPPGDDHPVTRALAADLGDPAQVLAVSARWRELSTVP